MDQKTLIEGLLSFLCFIPVLTFHEFAHAWVAWKCGDDTARLQGRVSLNPAVHIDPVGTIVLPLLAIFLSAGGSAAAGFIIGWGKPVPVNLNNLRNMRRDDCLIALAGPAMNVLLAIVLMGIMKIALMLHMPLIAETALHITVVSLFLCFFNLLPIPPLDGSHVMMNLIRLPYETYLQWCQYGIIVVILALQIPAVNHAINFATSATLALLAAVYRLS